jgi:hypothetical protein
MVGTDFARAMGELWGMDYEALERLAFETHGIPYSVRTPVVRDLPNLSATIDWCREGKVYPARFLRQYETHAEKGGVDRSRREWLLDLESSFTAQRKDGRRRDAVARKAVGGIRRREEVSGVYEKATAATHPAGARGKSRVG